MKQQPEVWIRDNFLANERLVLNFSRVLLVGMIYCLGSGLQAIAEKIFTGWNLGYIPYLSVIVAVEAIVSVQQVRRARDLELSVTIYRLVEWVVILTLLKVYFYSRYGWDQLWYDITNVEPGLLDRVFDPEYLLTALVLLLIWLLVTWTMNDLYEIESSLLLLDSAGYERYFSDTAAIRKSILQRLFGVGLIFIVVLGAVQANWSAMFSSDSYSPQVQNWYVLVYFMLLILLVGQTYFATLRAGWAWERIQIENRIARVWLGYGIVALLSISLAIQILPTRYSLNFFETIIYVVNFIIRVVIAIFFYIAMLASYLMAWLFSFLGGQNPSPEMPEIEQVAPPEPLEEVLQTATGPEIIQSIAFWVFLTLLIIFAFYQYARQNRSMLSKLSLFNPWSGLRNILAWVRRWTSGARKQVLEVVQSGLQRVRSARESRPGTQSFKFVNPNRMTPRQRILFFYLTMIRRAEEAGIPRSPAQTPAEFEQTLKSYLEQAEQPADQTSLAELTRSFQEARYSRHEINLEQVNRVQAAWHRLRQYFRIIK